MEWFISIPNHQQMIVLFKLSRDDTDGGWMLFEHKFPSYIIIDPDTNKLKCDAPIVNCGELGEFDKNSFEHLYHIPDGLRYGVYTVKGNRLQYIEPRYWNYIPPVDYKNVMPFMLSVK